MRRWLVGSEVGAVVDATHPYAATITAHAAQVCGELGLPHSCWCVCVATR
jgi:precorrin-6A/cobalt-precorrin-6A reductase